MTDKTLKLPEAGQWPDKLVAPALIAGAVLTTIGFLMAFFTVAPVGGATVNGAELIGDVMVSQKMLLSQKIFYFHMPVAITSFLALGFGCYYAVRFLMTKNRRFDTCSRICLEIALLFVVLTMITGEMWTRFEWGVWWSWEPRLTTYLILMLIVIAYFVLRSSVDEPERRATFAAVVAIIATTDVPICFMITRLIPSSIHPVVLREGGMSPEMGLCVGLCGIDGALFQAKQLDPELGLVGKLTKVDPVLVQDALDAGYIPVIASVAQGTDQDTLYNVSADTAASKLAVALGAERLLLLTNQRGILAKPGEESSLIPELQLSQVPALVKDGVISGDMIARVDCCVEAARSGVKSSTVLDGTIPHAILLELLSDAGVGTMLKN